MPRLGVVALLPEPLAAHVQAWRQALAEPFRDAIAPHLTLVPPQQVPADRLADARIVRQLLSRWRAPYSAEAKICRLEATS